MAGQIAKIMGARVIGIAGSPEKCRWVVEELGFDDCIDYRAEDVGAGLSRTCPNGIDVYFDNVGGKPSTRSSRGSRPCPASLCAGR